LPSAITLLDRYRGTLVGLATGDALGATLEFKAPGTFTPLHDMVGGGPFDLKAGEWTDDTSMALCLAESLIETGGFDAADQMRRYLRWWRTGRLSSRGDCFDIGNTVRQALERFEVTGSVFAESDDPARAGNGSLMRVAPVPLFYAAHRAEAIARAGESSTTTHASPDARDACRVLAALIVGALQGRDKDELLRSTFFESFVESVGPLSPRVAEVAAGSFARKQPPAIRGTGYAVDSLEAALWAFGQSTSFRGGALLAVNLGDDADTTGAVFGQLAGAYYGASGIPAEWRARLAQLDLIEGLAARLFDKAIAPIGRRKHVLDLTTGASIGRLNEILGTVGAHIARPARVRPLGYRQPEECSLIDFVNLCGFDHQVTTTIAASKTIEIERPAWSLLGLLEVDGRSGLLLVEAMARADDLKEDAATPAVAAAYIVASCGLDAVLLFLGFTGDAFFPDQFANPEAFASSVRHHLGDLVPPNLVGTRIPHKSGGSMSILVATLPVQEPSGQL
jgi:ADP-ribosyl-[dinitrogen reductase] hydrolase